MGEANYDYDNAIGDDIPNIRDDFIFLRDLEKERLKTLTDIKLLNKILSEGPYKKHIDEIVPNNRFKAYTIARNLQPKVKDGQKLSKKQREAFENVYAHFLAGG